MLTDKYLTTSELGKLLGISRIAVFKKIKNGQIKAEKIGSTYFIPKSQAFLTGELSGKDKSLITQTVKQAVEDYGEDFRLLGAE